MYGYGNSGNFLGMIIGIIIGCVVVFLICRELICWYYKINRLVALIEEQNKYLSLLVKAGGVQLSGPVNTSIKTTITRDVDYNQLKNYIVTSKVSLRNGPGASFEIVKILNVGDTLSFLEEKKDTENEFIWYKVKTKTNDEGWCLSDCLKAQ